MADGSSPLVATSAPLAAIKKFRVADLFCGSGGTSTGVVRAIRQLLSDLGYDVTDISQCIDLVAVNHWKTAIDTHTRNHPWARHHHADLESARPLALVPDGVLDLLCASPTCTYHSRARGGKPINDQMRMDPWHVVRWCTELRVYRILVENVPEFVDWGPVDLRTGKPIKARKGEYFRAWLAALEAIGFRLDWRILRCADYGDATTRERFFLIGCSDRQALQWPDPSHSDGGTGDLLGARQRWRGADQIIDWSREGKSIFTRKKPLAENTVARILAGAVRYGWPAPYTDALRALLEGREPVLDVPAGSVDPLLVNLRGTTAAHLDSSAKPIGTPVPTLTGGGTHVGMVMATASGGTARPTTQPVPTITTGGNGAAPHFVTPLLMGVQGTSQAKPVERPVPTITTGGASSTHRPGNARPQLIEPLIISKHSNSPARPVSEPMPPATTKGAGQLAEPLVAPYYGGGSGLTSQPVTNPVPAITTKARFGLAEPVLIRTDQTGSGATGFRSPSDPLHTLVSKANTGLAEAFVFRANQGDGRNGSQRPVSEPMPTITCSESLALAAPTGSTHRIDINYRMLHWRELSAATSFDDEGEIYDFAGTGTDITKQIGNAVPIRTSKALAMPHLMAILRGRGL